MPVSYTHLDVYKRQDMTSINLLPQIYIDDKIVLKIYEIILENKSKKREILYEKIRKNKDVSTLFEDIIFNLTDVPVSYTHLDVYKRQDAR